MDDAQQRLASAVRMQRELGMKGDNWDNYAVAQATLHDELGYNGTQRHPYSLDEATRDILIVHGRQDAAHALANTTALLKRAQTLTRLLYALFVAVIALGIVAILPSILRWV